MASTDVRGTVDTDSRWFSLFPRGSRHEPAAPGSPKGVGMAPDADVEIAPTRSIVVLFTDLVGSTALANRLDPETADELRQHHFSVLRQALSAHDGTEVKNLGDGLMVVFTSASAALSCATAMQQGVEADNRRQDPSVQVGIRVGVSAGEALHEEDDYFGDPVIEAARLCAQAEGGQILVAEWVKALAGRRVSFSFEARGALSLKGIPEAVETLSLSWEPVADEPEAADSEAPSIPLPAPVALGPDIGALVGQDEHNDVLTQAFKRVAAGEGREVVLICGEPGVGKSTVVASLARRAHELDAVVLVGHYDEEVTLSYQGFSEALSHYAGMSQTTSWRRWSTPTGPSWPSWCLHCAGASTPTGPIAAPIPTPRVTCCSRPPCRFGPRPDGRPGGGGLRRPPVGRHPKPPAAAPPGVGVGSFAPFDRGHLPRRDQRASHPLTQVLAALRREQRVTHMALDGLDEAGVLGLVEAAWGHSLDEAGMDLAASLCHETDGNPFFVSEMLRHLSETGALYANDQGHLVTTEAFSEMALPHSVRQVISARVARLGDQALSVLRLAAVIGRTLTSTCWPTPAGSTKRTCWTS